ncbi:MAG: carotenoid biosynthesis protein, partial [Cytophagales bacterium]
LSKTSKLLNILQKNGLPILIILHLVAAISCLFGNLEIMKLTTFNLIITLTLVLATLKPNQKTIWVLMSIFILSFAVEWLGTSTGFPFGTYYYGNAMPPLLFGVPLFIGVNWILVALGSRAVAVTFIKTTNRYLISILASILMVILDLIIEPICSYVDFWHWEIGHAPIQNFAAWWATSFIFQLMIQYFAQNFENNKFLVGLYILQFFFFTSLNISMFLWN